MEHKLMLLQIEVESEKPIYRQIYDQIVEGIANGRLSNGSNLPSIRQLAADFGINLHTVNKAYDLLEREGFILLRRKTGAVIQISPELATDWEDRQRAILAEAFAKNLSSEEILQRCRNIIEDFTRQRQLYSDSNEWSESL
jgi:DNA-binding transcriptional regulator YhcF (GntR family)